MKSHILLSSMGRDHPGILQRIANKIKKYDANIETQRISTLGGDFTILLSISMKDENVEPLLTVLNDMKTDELFIYAKKITPDALDESNGQKKELIVKGVDQIGITDVIASITSETGVNITSIVQDITHEKTPKLNFRAELAIPKDTNTDELSRRLKSMEKELYVSVDLKS